VSISRLKDQDKYERMIEHYLPNADIAFLDEIWKAGPSIQNALLTLLNEKIYRNGEREHQAPLKLLLAASNELPAQGEGLEALWDRFLIRYVVEPIRDDQHFVFLLQGQSPTQVEIPAELRIKAKEYGQWREAIQRVQLPKAIIQVILSLRRLIDLHNQHKKQKEEDFTPLYVSDRRWTKIVQLLKACAFMHQRESVNLLDLAIIPHCLWDKPENYELFEKILNKAIKEQAKEELRQNTGQQLAQALSQFENLTQEKRYVQRMVWVEEPELIGQQYFEVLLNVEEHQLHFQGGYSDFLIKQKVFEQLSLNYPSDIYLFAKHNYGFYISARAKKIGKNALELVVRDMAYRTKTIQCMLKTRKEQRPEQLEQVFSPEDLAQFDAQAKQLRQQIEAEMSLVEEERQRQEQHQQYHLFAQGKTTWQNMLTQHLQEQTKNLENLLVQLDLIQYRYRHS
jgi:MoxR-like ATPase